MSDLQLRPEELTPEEFRLLQYLDDSGGPVSWELAQGSVSKQSRAFKTFANELLERGLIEIAGTAVNKPPLRLGRVGHKALERHRGLVPTDRLLIRLRSARESPGNLEISLFNEGSLMVSQRVHASSHQLSALGYILLYAPGSITEDLAYPVVHAIGDALLPACSKCLSRQTGEGSNCVRCVRGYFRQTVVSLAEDEWLRLELEVEPPWTFVPWELASIGVSYFPAMDPRVSVARRIGQSEHPGLVPSGLRVFLAVSSWNSRHERSGPDRAGGAASREAQRVESLLTGSLARYVEEVQVEVLEDFRDAVELGEAIEGFGPNVVHLLGHGTSEGLATHSGLIAMDDLARAIAGPSVDIALLTQCFGATSFGIDAGGESLAAKIVRKGTRVAIGFNGQAEAHRTEVFVREFYRRLLLGCSAERAVMAGRASLKGLSYQWGQLVLFDG